VVIRYVKLKSIRLELVMVYFRSTIPTFSRRNWVKPKRRWFRFAGDVAEIPISKMQRKLIIAVSPYCKGRKYLYTDRAWQWRCSFGSTEQSPSWTANNHSASLEISPSCGTRARHWSLSWARCIQSTPCLRYILILSSHTNINTNLLLSLRLKLLFEITKLGR